MAGEILDRLATPRRPLIDGGAALAWRAALFASIWLLAMALTGRPLFAAAATLVSIGVIVVISNIKYRCLREPLVFSDFVLLEHVLRHPRIFYITRRWQVVAIVGVIALLAVIAAWMTVEPRAANALGQVSAFVLAAAIPAAFVLRPSLLASAGRLVRDPTPQADLARLGLLMSLFAYAVAWRLEPLSPVRAAAMNALPPVRYGAIVIIQAESFVDLRRLGRSDVRLPAFDRLKHRALASGLIEAACEGGYTLRPESAVLTGRGYHDQGLDRFHPYLRPHRLAATALPRRLAEAGWDTLFVHPHDPRFFRRAHAIPALGFVRFADERAFATARRVGPYVCDDAVAEFVLAEIRSHEANDRPLFLYAVTMEAHDPYGAGRLPDEDDPVQQYIRHVENADRMLARIAHELEGADRRVLLVFFGDHVPFLPKLADPFPDTRTDFIVVELGSYRGRGRVAPIVTRPEHLHALVCGLIDRAASARTGTAAD